MKYNKHKHNEITDITTMLISTGTVQAAFSSNLSSVPGNAPVSYCKGARGESTAWERREGCSGEDAEEQKWHRGQTKCWKRAWRSTKVSHWKWSAWWISAGLNRFRFYNEILLSDFASVAFITVYSTSSLPLCLVQWWTEHGLGFVEGMKKAESWSKKNDNSSQSPEWVSEAICFMKCFGDEFWLQYPLKV